MIDHPHIGKRTSGGKGPRTAKQRRRISGVEEAQRKADLERKRQQGDVRKAMQGVAVTWPQGRGGPQ